jgi:CRISPR/Cas system-associated exonuclease Cas4 (RecB family)
MPLAGTVCCRGGNQPFKHCTMHASKGSCKYPLHLIKYMSRNEGLREDVSYSVTSIIGCPRRQILQKTEDYYEDPDKSTARFVGDAVHEFAHALNLGEEGYVGEKRVHLDIELEGHVFHFSGKADQRWFKSKVVDLKRTERPPTNGPYPDHIAQVNCYAWMLWESLGEDITTGSITYITGKQHITYPVPIWTEEEQRDFILRRLREYLPYLKEGTLPPVLSPTVSTLKSGRVQIKRDWHCDWCPVRFQCDKRATSDAGGISPNDPEYWID